MAFFPVLTTMHLFKPKPKPVKSPPGAGSRPAPIRIAVVGDPGTGKTSLVCTAAHDTFDDRPPPILPPVILGGARGGPEDVNLSYEGQVGMLVTDTSSHEKDAAVSSVLSLSGCKFNRSRGKTCRRHQLELSLL